MALVFRISISLNITNITQFYLFNITQYGRGSGSLRLRLISPRPVLPRPPARPRPARRGRARRRDSDSESPDDRGSTTWTRARDSESGSVA